MNLGYQFESPGFSARLRKNPPTWHSLVLAGLGGVGLLGLCLMAFFLPHTDPLTALMMVAVAIAIYGLKLFSDGYLAGKPSHRVQVRFGHLLVIPIEENAVPIVQCSVADYTMSYRLGELVLSGEKEFTIPCDNPPTELAFLVEKFNLQKEVGRKQALAENATRVPAPS